MKSINAEQFQIQQDHLFTSMYPEQLRRQILNISLSSPMCVELDCVLTRGPIPPLHIGGNTQHQASLQMESTKLGFFSWKQNVFWGGLPSSWPIYLRPSFEMSVNMIALTSFVDAHQACAIAMMSPQGLSGSPYLPQRCILYNILSEKEDYH